MPCLNPKFSFKIGRVGHYYVLVLLLVENQIPINDQLLVEMNMELNDAKDHYFCHKQKHQFAPATNRNL